MEWFRNFATNAQRMSSRFAHIRLSSTRQFVAIFIRFPLDSRGFYFLLCFCVHPNRSTNNFHVFHSINFGGTTQWIDVWRRTQIRADQNTSSTSWYKSRAGTRMSVHFHMRIHRCETYASLPALTHTHTHSIKPFMQTHIHRHPRKYHKHFSFFVLLSGFLFE